LVVVDSDENYLRGPTQRGLDYIRHVGLPLLEKEVGNMNIPNVGGTTKTPLGAIEYKISNIHIVNVSIPKSNLTIDEEDGLTISCSHAELTLKAGWRFKEKSWPHISDSGSVKIHVYDFHLQITIYLDTHDERKPEVITRKCELGIKAVNVKFEGGASWLYNLFANAIANDLKGMISKEVCHAVSKLVDEEGDKILREVPEVVKIIKDHITLFNKMAAVSNNDT